MDALRDACTGGAAAGAHAVRGPGAGPRDVPLPLRRLLRRVRWVVARRRALDWVVQTTAVAAGASLVVTLLRTVVALDLSGLAVLAGGLGVALLAWLAGLLLPVGDAVAVARWADRWLGLRERTSTALELVAGRTRRTTLAGRTLEDATEAARRADGGAAFPHRTPPGTRRAAVLVAAAVAAAVVLPGITVPGTPAHQVAEQIRREGRRLEEAARRLEQRARTERIPEARRAVPEVRDVARRLQRERVTRPEALARLGALEARLEQARRQVQERLEERGALRPPPDVPADLFRPQHRLERQARQLRELAARLAQTPEGEQPRGDLLQRLGELAQGGEGELPAEARRRVEEARRQAEGGDVVGAGQALTEALQELEGLEALTADEEALRQAQRQVAASAERIAQGPGAAPEEESPQAARVDPPARAPGGERAAPRGEGGAEPGQGPHEGVQPGRGSVEEKLGAPTRRLDAATARSRVRGQEGTGDVQSGELVGPARLTRVRTPLVRVPAAVVRRADAYLARVRVPADRRAAVRRYFERLAQR
ncbi:MAG: hypothetical protein QN122_11695 [Armatimonadota bacterium]|nr:hypothetical protein [Armatimonadota bacterium]MDR7449161.1 hypothetical protein [Armatimonadota bacterium]MDR7460624.1 hypothetical protein [Armatimonadota bacterium]MDR7480796.1 hypothetical protein [Armatimonadota bacterium]MDR7492098.1 hypothetical protein [Armatimonadota bacterium]